MPVAVHTRETSHLPVMVSGGPTALMPRNYEDKFGSYFETFIKDSNVRVRRSFYASPPFAWEVVVTSTGDCSYPWLYLLPWRRATLLFVRGGADTWVSYSDSDGESWEVPVLTIAGGTKPFGAVCPFTGTEVIAAYIAATGKIGMRRRYAGAAAFEAAMPLKDDAGADLLFEDDTFAFHVGYEGPGRWLLHAHILGETATSTWWSGDDMNSLTRFV